MKHDINKIINELTIKEKSSLLSGYSNMSTMPIKRLSLESINFSDGPCGLRKENEKGNSLNGIANTLPATCFPSPINLANTWNKDLAYLMGNAIGYECNYYNVDVLLGPAINIQRNPLCGRNFEYYSEDPILSGEIATNFIKGLQEKNIGACIKHFACNNLEKYRFIGDSVVDERALNEIYLKPFEIAIKNANPMCVMSAYNKVNGTHCSENHLLLKDILKSKWNYEGFVMSDWGGIVSKDKAITNGNDLEMPGRVKHNIKLVEKAVKIGSLSINDVNDSIERYIKLYNKVKYRNKDTIDFKRNNELACDIACQSVVLLKNDSNTLPLKKDKKYLIIGNMFDKMRYQGSGSSMLNPIKLTTHQQAFKDNKIDFEYVVGYKDEDDSDLLNEAIEKAKKYDNIIVFLGQSDFSESEGVDRENLSLPSNQLSLMTNLCKLNKKIVCVLSGGSPVELPFIDKCSAMINIFLAGQAAGIATYKVLFGEKTPSGRLTQSWPICYHDIPFINEYAKTPIERYKESIFVGYRYYESYNKNTLFPFGYGLSYSEFKYSNLVVKNNNNCIDVTFDLKNVGRYDDYEVIQIYIESPSIETIRAKKELVYFDKCFLKSKEAKTIHIQIPFKNLTYYNVNIHDFKVENGTYKLHVSANVKKNYLSSTFKINKQKTIISNDYAINFHLNKNISDDKFDSLLDINVLDLSNNYPYTLETPIMNFNSFGGKMIKKIIYSIADKQYKKALKIKDDITKERQLKAAVFIKKMMPYNCLRSLCFSSSGMLKYNIALGMLEIANNHFLKAIICFIKKEK